jgi:hypothetical protein
MCPPEVEPFMRPGFQAAVFALLFAFAASSVAAEPRLANRARVEQSTLHAPALLSHLWGFLSSLWEAEGSRPDPLGTPKTDAGSRPDPLGSPTTDAGCSPDPLG